MVLSMCLFWANIAFFFFFFTKGIDIKCFIIVLLPSGFCKNSLTELNVGLENGFP